MQDSCRIATNVMLWTYDGKLPTDWHVLTLYNIKGMGRPGREVVCQITLTCE